MKLIWIGPVLDPSGYGSCARSYITALNMAGHDIKVQPIQYFMGNPIKYMDRDTYYLLVELANKKIGMDYEYVCVEHKTPGVFTKTKYKKNIGYTVWETDHIPEKFVNNVLLKDELWTASLYSKQAFINSGINIPIYIVPHIIDIDKFKPISLDDREESKPIVFMFNGEFTVRKGVDILIRAFSKAFSATDNVVLLLKTYLLNNKDYGDKYIISAINRFVDGKINPPKIKILTRLISDQDLPKLYKNVDVFVSATRGEGFGLPIAEAMASGNLVIVPNKGGHIDYCDSHNSILIDSTVETIPEGRLEDDRLIYEGQRWIESDEPHLISILRSVYINLNQYKYLRYGAVETIKEKFNKFKIIQFIERRLE